MKNVEIINEKGKMCKFDYDKSKNRLTLAFAGFLADADGAEEFLNEYGRISSSLCKDDTTLILDVKELKPFEQAFLDNLSELYKDYATFKIVYCIRSNNPITNLQTKRLLDKAGVAEKFILVDSIDEVK